MRRSRIFMPRKTRFPQPRESLKSVPEPFSTRRARSTGSVTTQCQSDLELLEQDGDGWQERQQKRIVEGVERVHAARDLAHDGAREAVGVPVGREALNAVEGILRDVAHHPQRQRNDT